MKNLNLDETYDTWAERVGIFKDEESREAWDCQQKKIEELRFIIEILDTNNKYGLL